MLTRQRCGQRSSLVAVSCLVALVSASAATLPAHRIGDTSYVAVPDLAAFYHLGRNLSTSDEQADYRGAGGQLNLQADSREVTINGVHHWLGQPIFATRGRLWIAAGDVLKALDPVLRTGRFPNNPPVRTVVLDAGHGGADRGTHGADNRSEKSLTLDLTKRIEKRLAAAGFTVLLTRDADEAVALDERVEFAKAKHADLFVSIHFNSGGNADGIETYCVPPAGAISTASPKGSGADLDRTPGNRFDEQNVWLAHCVQKTLLAATSANDRGVRRARFYVLRNATRPAILVEAGFLSNSAEEKKILQPEYRDSMAQAIVEGILTYKKTTETPTAE